MVLGLLCLIGVLALGSAVTTQEKSSTSGETKASGDSKDAVLNYLTPQSENLINADTSNEAALEEWKRAAHRLMHFGKRGPEQPRNLFDLSSVQADYNEGKRGSHRMMHFGKREPDQPHLDDKDLAFKVDSEKSDEADDANYDKRGTHRLMHFGKRDDEKRAGHKMMHFGKREEEDKRAGHKMMHFGKREGEDDKRAGHKMMHFGKRDEEPDGLDIKRAGHKMMHFGKRQEDEDEEQDAAGEEDKRAGHKMMHFGKRDEEAQEFAYEDYDKRAGHKMMHFGKREDEDKRAGHKMMHFGKKSDLTGQEQQSVSGSSSAPAAPRRTTRSVAPFFYDPYRSRDLLDLIQRLYREDAKRGHNIMRFGKRRPEGSYYEGEPYPESSRGGSPHHSLLHFGKRLGPDLGVFEFPDSLQDDDEGFDGFDDDFDYDQAYPAEMQKRLVDNSIMPFGKREEPWMSERELRQRLDDYKRGHSLLHFGKRYGDVPYEKRPQHTIMHFGKRSADYPAEKLRLKRSATAGSSDLRSLLWRPAVETGYLLPHALSAAEVGTLHVPMFVGQLNRIQRAAYPYYNLPKAEKKEHRNIYLHFG